MAIIQTIKHDGWDCTITESYNDVTGVRTYTTVWKPGSESFNRDDLLSKAAAALSANATYLATANGTAAQTAAQVKALTRQVDALIRLQTGRLEDTTGT